MAFPATFLTFSPHGIPPMNRPRFVPSLAYLPLCLLGCWTLAGGWSGSITSAARAEDSNPADLADQAVLATYEVKSLEYEKEQAQRIINGNKRTVEGLEKSLPMLLKTVEKLTEEKDAAAKVLAEKEKAAAEAKAAAEKSGTDADKAAAAKAEQARSDADRQFRIADQKHKQEASRLERTEQQLKDRRQQTADSTKAIPEKEAAAKLANAKAEKLRAEVLQANTEHAANQDPQQVADKIDELINARLKSAGVTASPQADDAEFLRRVTLDITGVIPSYEDVLTFLEDGDPHKRAALVDRLLTNEWYGRNFAQRFCTLTTENGTSTLSQGQTYFNDWLAISLQMNRRWDRIATDMLAADGFGYQEPGALFTIAYRMNEQPDAALLVGAAGDMFLGVQIKCAQCHDHPFQELSQQEFWGLAAMFGRVRLKGQSNNGRELEHLVTDQDVDPKEMVRMNGIKYPDQLPGGKIAIPDPVDPDKTLGTVAATFLDGETPQLPEKGNYREDFAKWATSPDNPYFAKVTVNRLWAHFFGRGIVASIDDLNPANTASHPEVLELLAAEFRQSDFDLQYLIRCITQTAAYQRSSQPTDGNETDKELLSHMLVKPLDSYALVDSLWVALQRTPPDGTRRREAAELYDTRLPGSDPTKYTHSIPQVLKMMNSNEHLGTSGPAVQNITRSKEPEAAIDHLYLAVLARHPAPEESQQMLAYLQELGDERQAYGDIYWVLLNSAEFLVNH